MEGNGCQECTTFYSRKDVFNKFHPKKKEEEIPDWVFPGRIKHTGVKYLRASRYINAVQFYFWVVSLLEVWKKVEGRKFSCSSRGLAGITKMSIEKHLQESWGGSFSNLKTKEIQNTGLDWGWWDTFWDLPWKPKQTQFLLEKTKHLSHSQKQSILFWN